MCEDKGGCNFCQRKKPNKNKIKSTPTQSPLPTGPKGSKGPQGPKGPEGHKGPKGPKGLADSTWEQRNKNSAIPSPYQNSPLVPGSEWNTIEIEDFNRATIDHGLNIEPPTLKKVIYLETLTS